MKRVGAAILGATGTVGQRFAQLLEGHPWFEVRELAASERSIGRSYREACAWRLTSPMPLELADRKVVEPDPRAIRSQVVFSGLTGAVAGEIEAAFASSGHLVISNAGSHRMDPDVPLIIPEVNADHLGLLEEQRRGRGWTGAIITNPNCSTIALALALAPLEQRFGIRSAVITTLQAISGAGYPGVAAMDILGNVLPHIAREEEKIERETTKIFGRLADGGIQPHQMALSAQTFRVPVAEGHTEAVSVSLRERASLQAVMASMRDYRSLPQQLQLPSAPARPVVLLDEVDRPQPRLDLEWERGMATAVGRLRPCNVFDVRFVLLGHNTIRGAAGAAILNAELLQAQGYLDIGELAS